MSKTFLVSVSFFLLSITPIIAQQIIPKFGTSLASVAGGSLSTDVKYKFGMVGGVAFNIPLSGMVSIQPELLFHQKEFKGTGVVTVDYIQGPMVAATADESYTLNYIELPILVKLKISRFYINVGPYLAYGIGGKCKIENSEGKIKLGDPAANTHIKAQRKSLLEK